jgi:hypothetical protein
MCPVRSPSRSKVHRALLDLSHQQVSNKVLWKLLDRYRRGNPARRYDRALVLISGSFLEQGLESVIATAMVREYDDRDGWAELFGGDRRGAIDGFRGKIVLGHALGAYPKTFKEDLDRVRHIRNAFAHSRDDISFRTKEVADVCQFQTTDHFGSGDPAIHFSDARARYVFMVFFASLTFDLILGMTGDERPESYDADAVLP